MAGRWYEALIQIGLNRPGVKLPALMVAESLLSEKMLESLYSYRRVIQKEIRLKEAAATREGGAVTIGSYFRTVQQGRKKIRASIVTVLIALWADLVKPEDLLRLLELARRTPGELSEDEAERFEEVLNALLDKLLV